MSIQNYLQVREHGVDWMEEDFKRSSKELESNNENILTFFTTSLKKISPSLSLSSVLCGIFTCQLISLLAPPFIMELSEGKKITTLWAINHSYGNSECLIMAVGTSNKLKITTRWIQRHKNDPRSSRKLLTAQHDMHTCRHCSHLTAQSVQGTA